MIPQNVFQAMSRFQKINQLLPRINTLLGQFTVLTSSLISQLFCSKVAHAHKEYLDTAWVIAFQNWAVKST